MRKTICFLLLMATAYAADGQTYADSIAVYRKSYIEDILSDKRRPLTPAQAHGLNFFAPDRDYCVIAGLRETPGLAPFMIPTHSGKLKPFRLYGVLVFTLLGKQYFLQAYQSVDLINDAANKDHLFIPFKDMTNYAATYGGGRYLDLNISDIKNERVVLDFNKSYNPYCAYADGFNCPIPPKENNLAVEINAGEKTFTP